MKKLLLFIALLLCCSMAEAKKEKQAKQPKVTKLSTLKKNARTALKNGSGQEAAQTALLQATTREGLTTTTVAGIRYTAALLDESMNGVENRKAYLKQAYDTAKFFNKLRDMYEQLRICDSIDCMPSENGVVHPHYAKRTCKLREKHRMNILLGGRFFLRRKDYKSAFSFFQLYCKHTEEGAADSLYPKAKVRAAILGFLIEDYAGMLRHADEAIALADPSHAAVLTEYKARAWQKLGNDSACVAALQQGMHDYPLHDFFFVNLADRCHEAGNYGEEVRLADDVISRTGGRTLHFYARSRAHLADGNYEACIANADSVISRQDDYVDAYYNKGVAYLNMALIQQEESCKDPDDPQYDIDRQKTQELYRAAMPCMETVRRMQPDKKERWGSALYRIYLNLNMGEEFSEIDKLL